MSELPSWPFCGSTDIDPRSGGTPSCFDCGASPGNSDWSTRPPVTVQEAAKVLLAAEMALKPFANKVYIDNGDITVTNWRDITADDCKAAYFAQRRIAKAIRALAEKETGE